ncbi:hypothetical protein BGZ96_000322 [Linnemannia gamsii]|uniref:Uncharacterized protein n=1 Tax=Linnemannia gamsii TaxID=64522 RepID=A0ABQ7JP70_9FUNG|nr:hypothetical protein BGZ96_000322 [Linnemannia gamsii]
MADDPATLAEPRKISVQQSFHRILHPTSSNHAAPQPLPQPPPPSIRASKFPFASTPSMFKALGPRDMDILNSQEIVRLAIYVMKRSPCEFADPVLCEKVHTEGEKKRSSASASATITTGTASGALKRVSSIRSSTGRKGEIATTGSYGSTSTGTKSNNMGSGSSNNTVTARSIYLTKDFDIGNSVLHHRSKRPSKPMESVLSIATFCARAASRPSSVSQAARRPSASSSSGVSEHGHGNNDSGGRSSSSKQSTAALVGAKWLAKLGQVVFGGPCAQAGHSHHRRMRHNLDLLDPRTSTNESITTTTSIFKSSSSGTSVAQGTRALTEKLCKHCSGAMTCLAISILRESSSSTSTTDSERGRGIGGGQSNAAKTLPGPPPAGRAPTTIHDSGFESGIASGLELLDAHSDDVTSDTSSSSSLSPSITSTSRMTASETGTLLHGQSSHATPAGIEDSPRMTINEDYRPRLELKHKTRIRPRQETTGSSGSTPRMASPSSPSGGGASPFIIFDKSHLNKSTAIPHPLESDPNADISQLQHHQQQAGDGQDLYEEESEAGEDAWSPSSALSDSIAEEFGPEATAGGGNWRSNMYAPGTYTPRAEDLDNGDEIEDLPMGQRVKTRLERDLAEALGTPVLDQPFSSSSSPLIAQQTVQPVVSTAAVPLVPSIHRPSITGLGIHAPVRNNGNDSDGDEGEDDFHLAIDHFIHPLSTSPHNSHRVSPRATTPATPLVLPGATPLTATNAIKNPASTAVSPRTLQPSSSSYSSSPPSLQPIPPAASLTALASLIMENNDDVATPVLPSTIGYEKDNDKEEGEEEAESGPKSHPFYGVGIHGRASVDEYAQEVGESMQRKKGAPLTDLGRGSVPLPAVDHGKDDKDDKDEEKEEEEERKEKMDVREVAVAISTGDDDSDGRDGADKDNNLRDLKTEDAVPAAGATAVETSPVKVTKVNDSSETDNVGSLDAMDSPPTTTTIAAAEATEEEPTVVTEIRPSTLRHGGVGLHALTPSDDYVQDIGEAMQRPPPVDLRPPSDDSDKEIEVTEEPEAIVGLVSLDDDGDNGSAKNPVDETEEQLEDEGEDEVETDDEATNATTAVSSAIDRIEDESFASTETISHLATALRYGAVGLHGKTPFDEYAHEIEESIHRGVQVGQSLEGEDVVGVESSEEEGYARSETAGSDRDLDTQAVIKHVHDKNKEGAANKPIPPSISTRPFPSVSTFGDATTHTCSSSSDFDPSSPSSFSSSSDFLDDSYDSSNPSSPSTAFSSSNQTAVQKELQDLRRRRRKIQLVDDAKRKKEQLDRIREHLERKTLGKIREQVSFWETKGVLEQKVVGAEEVLEDDDEAEGGKVEGDEGESGERGATTEKYTKKSAPTRGLSLSQEHLRGMGSGGKKSNLSLSSGGGGGEGRGEQMSPGNSQSPGDYYSEIPQLAPRRSLPTISSTSDKVPTPLPGSVPSSAPESSEMDAFLSNVD